MPICGACGSAGCNCVLQAGCGIAVAGAGNPWTVSVDVDTDPTNLLVCPGPNGGLFVPPTVVPINTLDTDCIDLSGDGTVGNELTADLVVDPAGCVVCTAAGVGLVVDPVGCLTCGPGGLDVLVDTVTGGGDNTLVCTPGTGLYVPPPVAVGILTLDTDCIDLTGNGTPGFELRADPIVDPNASNLLACGAAGMLVLLNTVSNGCVTLSGDGTAGAPLDADLLVDPVATNLSSCGGAGLVTLLNILDTNCIDLSGDGTAGNPLSADPIISGAAGNQLSCTPAGLFVPAGAGFSVLTLDTNCIDLTGDGTLGNELQADPIIDPNASNLLACGGSGLIALLNTVSNGCVNLSGAGTAGSPLDADLLVDPNASNLLACGGAGALVLLNTVTNGCVALSGAGTAGSPLDADLIISPDAGNQAVCQANGLFVPATAFGGINILDTNCINLTGDGTLGTPLQADPIIDPNASNLLACGASGLVALLNTVSNGCVTLSGAGTAGSPLDADLLVDPNASNLLACGGAGALVLLNTVSNGCVTLSGAGTAGSPLDADIAIGSGVVCAGGVLNADIQTVNNGCVNLTGAGTAASPLDADINIGSGVACVGNVLNAALVTNSCLTGAGTGASPLAPVISPNAGNTLSCLGNGLFAAGVAVQSDCTLLGDGSAGLPLRVDFGTNHTIWQISPFGGFTNAPPLNVNQFGAIVGTTITNPSACRSMRTWCRGWIGAFHSGNVAVNFVGSIQSNWGLERDCATGVLAIPFWTAATSTAAGGPPFDAFHCKALITAPRVNIGIADIAVSEIRCDHLQLGPVLAPAAASLPFRVRGQQTTTHCAMIGGSVTQSFGYAMEAWGVII